MIEPGFSGAPVWGPAGAGVIGMVVGESEHERVPQVMRPECTWRSADMLYRLRLVDKIPATGRTFRTGMVGDPKKLSKDARKPVVRYKINHEALQANALSAAWQVLTEPTEQDRLRREHGPDIGNMDPLMASSLGLDAG